MSGQWIEDPTSPSGWRYDDTPSDPTVTSMLPVYAGGDVAPVITAGSSSDTAAEQPSRTAGEQDHTDPWCYAGAEADPPADCGRPA